MDHFQLIDGAMGCGGVALAEIAAAAGTPADVCSTVPMVRQPR